MAKRRSSVTSGEPPQKRAKEDDEVSDAEDLSSTDSRSTDGSDDGADLEGFIVKDEDNSDNDAEEAEAADDASEDIEAIAKAEAQKITENMKSTTVGGRTLRDRSTIKKPQVFFDEENYKKLLEQEEKREKIMMLKKWAASGEYVCPILASLSKKTSPEVVDEEYRKAKSALEIPDTDDEDDEEDEEEESADASTEDETFDGAEEDDEEEEDSDEDEDDEDEDEDASEDDDESDSE